MSGAGEGWLAKERQPGWWRARPQSAQQLGFQFGVFGRQCGELGSLPLDGLAGCVCRAQAVKVRGQMGEAGSQIFPRQEHGGPSHHVFRGERGGAGGIRQPGGDFLTKGLFECPVDLPVEFREVTGEIPGAWRGGCWRIHRGTWQNGTNSGRRQSDAAAVSRITVWPGPHTLQWELWQDRWRVSLREAKRRSNPASWIATPSSLGLAMIAEILEHPLHGSAVAQANACHDRETAPQSGLRMKLRPDHHRRFDRRCRGVRIALR